MVSAIGVDNTSVNIGEHNSIKSRVVEKNPEIVVISHCSCHILHNAASKGKSVLKEYYDFCDEEYEEVIKYISTRWLCSERCVNRELRKYNGLRSSGVAEQSWLVMLYLSWSMATPF